LTVSQPIVLEVILIPFLLTGSTARRDSTVNALYDRLNIYHLVLVRNLCSLLQIRSNTPLLPQVRGTPASGKSTLAQLLANHITTQEPAGNLIVIASWPDNGLSWLAKLTNRYDDTGPNTIIIDEAQLSYWDTAFWNGFLKTITPDSPNRVILFASYGSPAGAVTTEGTQMVVPDCARVGLRSIDHGDGVTPAGLFLTTDEFADMIRKKYPTGRFKKDFLDYVFRVTAGHAGAVFDLLRVVWAHDVSLRIKL
jgi:hypothetical protein